jgi:hypothetical protein
MKMKLITYGCGKKFDHRKFKPIKNRMHVKPEGGLWASPVGAEYGWREWCEAENYGDLSCSFTFEFEGNVFVIDSLEDAARLPWVSIEIEGLPNIPGFYLKYPDFEKMIELGYDAIYMTDSGQAATRFGNPSLYGWDCECVLIMNPKGVK